MSREGKDTPKAVVERALAKGMATKPAPAPAAKPKTAPKRKPGAGRPRFSDPNLSPLEVLKECDFGDAIRLEKQCNAFKVLRANAQHGPFPDTPWGRKRKAEHSALCVELGTWLAGASLEDRRLFLKWASRPFPEHPVRLVDFFLTQHRFAHCAKRIVGNQVHFETPGSYFTRANRAAIVDDVLGVLSVIGCRQVTRNAVDSAIQKLGSQRKRGRPRKPPAEKWIA